MTLHNENMNFDDAIAAVRGEQPTPEAMEAAAGRAWQRIQQAYSDPHFASAAETIRSCEQFRELLAERDAGTISAGRKLLLEDHLRECAACRHYSEGLAEPDAEAQKWTPAYQAAARTVSWGKLSAYAALFVAAALGAFTVNYYFFAAAPGMRARVEGVQGNLYVVSAQGDRAVTPGTELQEGELLRTSAGSHAFVRLADGSRVEMNERAEFAVASTRRNTTIRLQRGNVIVEAAHRTRGHLYVATADCRVAVTGTVFSVNSGLKGSRVAVIEGNVDVGYSGQRTMLHAGDEVNTSSELGAVPIKQEISWSENLDHYLALLAEFSKLKQQLEQIPLPGPRYESTLLARVPVNAKIYASIPNLGEALAEANQVFQQQLQQSPVLQQWWAKMQRDNRGPKPEEIIEKVRQASQYLGDEIVFTMASFEDGKTSGIAMAEIKKPGLADFLRQQVPNTAGAVYDQQSLASAAPNNDAPLFLVRNDLLVIATDYAALRQINQQLNAGPTGFAQTAFAQHILPAYTRGAGMLFAADLKSMMHEGVNGAGMRTRPSTRQSMSETGFNELDYLIVERRDFNSATADNRATLAFTGERHGIASWLAAPAPIGSLDFISAEASGAIAMVVKSPAQMLNDLLAVKHDAGGNPPAYVNELAAAFGGDYALALDGPVLPQPAWRFVAEVNDPQRAQYAVEQLLQDVGRHSDHSNQPTPTIQSSVQDGRTFYTVTGHGQEIDYTFSDGYMIAGPSIAMVMKSLRVHQSGNSLARSGAFRALLPQGSRLDYSAVAYQNLSPVIQPLAGQLTGTQLQSLQTIAAGSKPSAVVAYGEPDRIEVQTSSKFFGLDLNTFALGALLGNNPLVGKPAGTY
jgi:hypothetical protein